MMGCGGWWNVRREGDRGVEAESGYRIVAAAAPWMTTQDAAHGKVEAFDGAMLLNGFHGIL